MQDAITNLKQWELTLKLKLFLMHFVLSKFHISQLIWFLKRYIHLLMDIREGDNGLIFRNIKFIEIKFGVVENRID